MIVLLFPPGYLTHPRFLILGILFDIPPQVEHHSIPLTSETPTPSNFWVLSTACSLPVHVILELQGYQHSVLASEWLLQLAL